MGGKSARWNLLLKLWTATKVPKKCKPCVTDLCLIIADVSTLSVVYEQSLCGNVKSLLELIVNVNEEYS